MALPAPLKALYDLLQSFNGDPHNATSNPYGFARGGNEKPVDNFIKAIKTFADYGKGISDLTAQAGSDAAQTAADRVQTGKDVTSTGTARDKAKSWANAAEGVEVETGLFSAFHWMKKALAAATSAFDWANAPEDTVVQDGNYSALHWARKGAAIYDAFDDRFLGAKASDPAKDNDGNALIAGAIYFSTADNLMKVWNGSAWQYWSPNAADFLQKSGGTMSGLITFFANQFASQADAEAGTDQSKLMTPQRVAQAIAKLVAPAKFEGALLHVRDEKASGTNGGTPPSLNAWNTRALNAILTNQIGATLASNLITLPAGTYDIEASAPSQNVGYHRLRLWDVSAGGALLLGPNAQAANSGGVALLGGRFTLGAQKQVRLDHYTQSDATNGFGSALASAGVIEVYANVKIWKLN